MSETEFELMDELYFVQHYSFLKEELQWEDDQILSNLESFMSKNGSNA
jgi:hypothetical protein